MEKVSFSPPPAVDWDGNVTASSGETVECWAVVSPTSLQDSEAVDWEATTDLLQVLTDPLTPHPGPGWGCTIRGEHYTVVRSPWDWSVGRAPANPRHRPRLAFIVRRSETFD